jgi:hypothetical protein
MDHDSSPDQSAGPSDSSGHAKRRAELLERLKALEQQGWISFGNGVVKMVYKPDDPQLSVWMNTQTGEEHLSPELRERIEQLYVHTPTSRRKKIIVIYSAQFGETHSRRYELEITSTGDDQSDCNFLFHFLNHPDANANEANPLAKDRSLSPGDGVIIDGRIYRCAGLGWEQVDSVDKLACGSLG